MTKKKKQQKQDTVSIYDKLNNHLKDIAGVSQKAKIVTKYNINDKSMQTKIQGSPFRIIQTANAKTGSNYSLYREYKISNVDLYDEEGTTQDRLDTIRAKIQQEFSILLERSPSLKCYTQTTVKNKTAKKEGSTFRSAATDEPANIDPFGIIDDDGERWERILSSAQLDEGDVIDEIIIGVWYQDTDITDNPANREMLSRYSREAHSEHIQANIERIKRHKQDTVYNDERKALVHMIQKISKDKITVSEARKILTKELAKLKGDDAAKRAKLKAKLSKKIK